MAKKLVLFMYRTKLRLCNNMGYRYGTWDPFFHNPRKHSSLKYIHFLIRKNKIGHYIWNNVREEYKAYKNIKDPIIIDELINDSFTSLNYINYIYTLYKDRK